jgi:hypothetical protein
LELANLWVDHAVHGYFSEGEVRGLVTALIGRFPGMDLMFDAIPRWFSRKTLKGFGKTRHYTAPPMPWGINRDELEPTLRGWSRAITRVHIEPYGIARGPGRLLLGACRRLPVLRNLPPTIVHVSTAAGSPR